MATSDEQDEQVKAAQEKSRTKKEETHMAEDANITRTTEKKTKEEKKIDERDQELLRKLPDETTPAQEWGEGFTAGKVIATGGKSAEELGAKAEPERK